VKFWRGRVYCGSPQSSKFVKYGDIAAVFCLATIVRYLARKRIQWVHCQMPCLALIGERSWIWEPPNFKIWSNSRFFWLFFATQDELFSPSARLLCPPSPFLSFLSPPLFPFLPPLSLSSQSLHHCPATDSRDWRALVEVCTVPVLLVFFILLLLCICVHKAIKEFSVMP